MATRTENTAKNIVWGYVGNIVSLLVQFASRTIFIYTLGVSFLGINGLFTSVLGMLSLTELGIGTAINYSLYKPVAEDDTEKIKSLMLLYKKAYQIIALIVTVIGFVILPFLPFLIKEASDIPNVSLYYVIFLFNTVSSYFVSYKYGLVNAEQKGYIINNLNSIFNIVITVGQSIILLLFHNYLAYLVTQAFLQLVQKISIGIFLNKKYPYLQEKAENLAPDEKQKIKKNVGALVLHKIGEISIYQTDNIIISAFISVILVGKISNYNLIITSVTSFITIIFNSVTASMGNLIATSDSKRQVEVFDIYNFLGFWLYGFASVCYWVLFTPFITLWIGVGNIIDEISLALLILSQYLTGQRLTVNNVKVAGGIFQQDKYVSLIQGGVNLVISLVLGWLIGLPGIYIGTVVSGLIANIIKPIIVYKHMYQMSAKRYFLKFCIYISVTMITAFLLRWILSPIVSQLTWIRFFVMAVICAVAVNCIFALVFFKSKELQGIISRLKNILQKRNFFKKNGGNQ